MLKKISHAIVGTSIMLGTSLAGAQNVYGNPSDLQKNKEIDQYRAELSSRANLLLQNIPGSPQLLRLNDRTRCVCWNITSGSLDDHGNNKFTLNVGVADSKSGGYQGKLVFTMTLD